MIDQRAKDLSLLLILLTGWEEERRNGAPGEKIFRAWKGYSYEIMDSLQKDKLIYQPMKAKSLILTEDGRKRAEELRGRLMRA